MFSINNFHTNLRRQCTSNVGIKLWNDLPIDITNTTSIYLKDYKTVQLLAMLLSCDDKIYRIPAHKRACTYK